MKKFLEMLWAGLEMDGKQLYDRQKIKIASINTYEVQTNNYDKGVTMILSEKYHHDSKNNSQIKQRIVFCVYSFFIQTIYNKIQNYNEKLHLIKIYTFSLHEYL